MTPFPPYQPKQRSLGPLETEILEIVWDLGIATVKDVHDRILADPDRELAYVSVTTVLRRLTHKGWLSCDTTEKAFTWKALISREQAQILQACDRLNEFLAISNPDIVAAFADHLDAASVDQLDAIAKRLQAARKQRQEGQ